MTAKNTSHLPIRSADLGEERERTNNLLVKVTWKPSKKPLEEAPAGDKGRWRPDTSYQSAAAEDSVSLVKTAKSISGDPLLLTDTTNHLLQSLRKGLQIGMYLAREYGQSAGLERLVQQNRLGRLTQLQKTEFFEKHHTSSAVLLYSMAAYVHWELASYESEKVSGRVIEFPGIPEIDLSNPLKAAECQLYYLGKLSETSGLVQDDLSWVKFTLLFTNHLMEELRARVGSLRHKEFFTNVSYKLEDCDFVVEGFEDVSQRPLAVNEFNRLQFSRIVGNRAAKHAARRLAQRLVCYDPVRKTNPFLELGGLPLVRMGFGKPGTGKSMQIAATATLIDEYCTLLGLTFLFWPMPDNIISTFQGGSAERMTDYMRRLQDHDKVIYAPIDDAENSFEERSRQGVSAGVREVIGVFLRYTEGAYAISRGNATVEFFTNLPEQFDKAVLSRIQARFPIDGAETREDFLDQDFLWWKKIKSVDERFISMRDPSDYQYLDSQANLSSLLEIESGAPEITDQGIRQTFAKLSREHDPEEHDFFARLFHKVQQLFPAFSSRDVRNIQQAVNNRITDFDMPDEWLDKPDLFYFQDYDTKVDMLKELMRGNMKGLSFAQIRLQETMKYLQNLSVIANQDRERQIAQRLEMIRVQQEAEERFRHPQ